MGVGAPPAATPSITPLRSRVLSPANAAQVTERAQLTGHTASVMSVALAPDGQTLATASADSTIKLWRVSDGMLLHTLILPEAGVTSIAFAPDGRALASGSEDRTVRLWSVAP